MKTLCLMICSLVQLMLLPAFAQHAPAAEGKSLKIAMVLWRGETRAEKGLKDGLKELGYSAEYITYSADQDKEKLAEILRNEIEPKAGDFDYIYCFGTTTMKMAKSILGNKVPQFFSAVSFPVKAEIVDSMEAPGGNISGVTNAVPIEKQLELARTVVPFKKLGVMFNPREKNAIRWAEEMNELSRKMAFEVVDLDVSPKGRQLERTLQRLIERDIDVDAIFLPNDSFLISEARLIGEKLRLSKIPQIGAHEDFIKEGVLMGVVVDYYEMGMLAARIVDQNRKGKKMGEIPVAISNNPKLIVNRQTCDLLGIRLPEEIADSAQMVE